MKKKSFIVLIIILFIIIISGIFIMKNVISGNLTSNNSNIEHQFRISKVHYYSGVDAENNKTTYQNPEWNLNIYQYTDIAIYVERLNQNSQKNYIKELYIDNIKFDYSGIGKKELHYLSPMNFGKSEFNEENIIDSKIEYSIVNSQNKENDITYNIPIYFEDCSNPITLKYLNRDIVKNYIVENDSILTHDGRLLKDAEVSLKDLDCKVKLDINIVTIDDVVHSVTVPLSIPINNGKSQIYNGDIEVINKKINLEF